MPSPPPKSAPGGGRIQFFFLFLESAPPKTPITGRSSRSVQTPQIKGTPPSQTRKVPSPLSLIRVLKIAQQTNKYIDFFSSGGIDNLSPPSRRTYKATPSTSRPGRLPGRLPTKPKQAINKRSEIFLYWATKGGQNEYLL